MKLRPAGISEYSVLRDLVRNQIDGLQGQIRILEKEIPTDWGPVMLGIDGEGRPVVLMISIGREDDLIARLIGIYRWTQQSMPLLIRFCAKGWLDTSKIPRFVVIVPGSGRAVQDGLNLLSFSAEAYIWRGIEINGELSVLLEPAAEPAPRFYPFRSGSASSGLLEAARLTEEETQFFERGNMLRG